MAVKSNDLTYALNIQTSKSVKEMEALSASISDATESSKKLETSIFTLQETSRDLGQETAKLDQQIAETSKTELQYQKALDHTAKSLQDNSKSFAQLTQGHQIASHSFNGTISILAALTTTITGVTLATQTMKQAFQIATDPRITKAAEDLLIILQYIATVKGFDKLADTFELMRERVERMTAAMAKFREMVSGDIFQTISDVADKANLFLTVTEGLGIAAKSIAATLAIITGFSVWGTISREGLDLMKILGGIKETFTGIFQLGSQGFAKLTKDISLSKISISDLHDAFSLFSVGGTAITAINLLTGGLENITAESIRATAASIAFSLALKGLIIYVGALIESVGQRLSAAMEVFVEKFAKTQQVVTSFGFVVKNFGNAYGEDFIGSLREWQNQIERLANTTTFSSNEIIKSTKLVIAENKALGMSYEENVKFLDRAVEIASSSGLELIDVVQRMQSALVGNSTAVAALGINLSAHALEHSELNKTIQKTVMTMSEQEKKQIALFEIYKQTEPLVGSAIKQGQTIIGINKQIANSYEQIQSKLGSVNVFTMALSAAYADLVRNVSNLPQIFYDIVGVATDFGAISLQVIGFIFKWILVITTLVTAYKIFNAILVTNIALQTKLNSIAQMLGLTFQFQATQVTTASSALALFGKTLKGAVLFVLNNVQAAAIGAAKAIGQMTLALVTNPLFLKAALIAATIALVVQAIDELNQEMNIVNDAMAEFQEDFVQIKGILTATGGAMVTAFSGAVQIIKILLISLGYLWQIAKIVWNALRMIWDPENVAEYKTNIDAVLDTMDTMALSHTKALDKVAGLWDKAVGGSTAYGQALDSAAKLVDELAFKQLQLNRVAGEIDTNTLRIEALGTEVEKLTNRYMVASKAVEKHAAEVMSATEISADSLRDYKKALEEQTQVSLDLDKARIDRIKAIGEITKEVQRESLQLVADETAKINAAFNERRDAVKQLEAELSRLGPIAGESAQKIIQAFQSIEQARKAAIQSSQDKADKEANENYLRFLKEQNDLLDGIAKRNRELQMDALGNTITERQKINEMLKFDTEELEKQIEHYRIQWGSQSAIVQGLEKQKALLQAAAATQKDMADMEFPDWVDELGDAINAAFGKENIDSFFTAIKDQIEEISSTPIVMEIRKVVKEAAQSPAGKAIGAGMESVMDTAAKAGNILIASGGAMASALAKAGGWVGGLIDVFINADKYLRVLIDFPQMFLKIIMGLPGLVKQFIDTFPKGIRAIAEALPGILVTLVDMIPDFIESFLNAIPTLIERIAEAIPIILVKLVAMLPKLVELVVKGIAKSIQGLIKGLIRGIQRLFSGKLPKVEINTEGLKKQMKKLQGSSERLFNVAELADAVKDPLDKMMDGIKEGFASGANLISKAWKWVTDNIITPLSQAITKAWRWVLDNVITPIASVLKVAWMWVYDNVIKPITGLVKDSWLWVYNSVIKPMITAIQTVWSWVDDNIIRPIYNTIVGAFKWVDQNIIKPMTNAIRGAFDWVLEKVVQPLAEVGQKIAQPIVDAFKGLMNIFNSIGEAFKSLFKLDFSGVKDAISDAFSNAAEFVKKAFAAYINPFIGIINMIFDLLNALKFGPLEWSISAGKLGKWSGTLIPEVDLIPGTLSHIPKLATGGLVTTEGALPIPGPDTAPRMLQPGEFVIRKPAVQALGADFLEGLNRGKRAEASQEISIDMGGLTINIQTNKVDDNFISRELAPKIIESIKRASIDGKFVISSRGIRTV